MNPFKIYIVEDDPWYGEILEYHLSLNPDYLVQRFTTAKECLANLYKLPDLVTIDFSLPDMTGDKLFEKIRDHDAHVPIIAISAHKLTTKSVGKDKLLWAIYLLLAAVTVITESEVAWLFLAAGVLVWFWRAPPRWLRQGRANAIAVAPVAAASGVLGSIDWPLLSQLGAFFAKAGAFVFGSGLAIVPFL